MKCANCGNKDIYSMVDEGSSYFCYECNHRTDKYTGLLEEGVKKDKKEINPLGVALVGTVVGAIGAGAVGVGVYSRLKKKKKLEEKKKSKQGLISILKRLK